MSVVNRSLAFTLAGLASCDWRTAARFLSGETIRGLAAERLRAAAAQLRIAPVGSTLEIAASQPLAISSLGESSL